MGVENKVMFDICDVIRAKCRVKQALIQDSRYPSLYILPSAHTNINGNITGENVKNVIDMLDQSFDYILIDCPAGVDAGFHRAVFSANEALIVVTPHISSIRDADKVLTILSSYNLFSTGLVVNRAVSYTHLTLPTTSRVYDCTLKYKGFMGAIRRTIKKRV